MSAGLFVMNEMFGTANLIYPVTMVAGAYLLMMTVPQIQANKFVIAYIAIHFSCQSIWKVANNYSEIRDFVIPSMILIQKLWRLSCIYRDGAKEVDLDTLKTYEKAKRLVKRPELLPYLSYCFSVQSAQLGPNFCFHDYVAFIELKA
jgi:hypothetical protein